MQPKEQPFLKNPVAESPVSLDGLDRELSAENHSLKKLWTSLGDTFRDIDTANKMAKDKFDGDTALMHAARGAVTTGIGVGLEKAMGFVWGKVWAGKLPYYERHQFGEGMAEKFNAFASDSNLKSRLAYFIQEGTQDLSIALFYNFMAFRSQPILPKANPEHLVRSLGVNAIEAFTLPGIPDLMKDRVNQSQLIIAESKYKNLRREFGDVSKVKDTTKVIVTPVKEEGAGGANYSRDSKPQRPFTTGVTSYEFHQDIDEMRDDLKVLRDEWKASKAAVEGRGVYEPGSIEKVLHPLMITSNPVTQLGAEWMATGISDLIRNIREVRKARRERGGMEGKRVFMPRKDDRHGDRRPHDRQWQDRRSGDNRHHDDKKVYYGKSNWEEDLKQYELKGS